MTQANAKRAESAFANLQSALKAVLQPDQLANIESMLDAYLSCLSDVENERIEDERMEAASKGYESGKEDGYDEGRADALEDISPDGQARIDVIASLRRLENEARCPFEMRTYQAIADIVESN